MPPLGEEEIDVAVVVRVAGADSLSPTEVADAGFGGDVLEVKAAEVVIEVRRERRPRIVQPVTLHKENIREAVVVVIEDRYAGAGIFDDVRLVQIAGDDLSGEAGLRSDIAEVDDGRLHARRKRAHGLIGGIAGNHLRKHFHSDQQRRSQRENGKREKAASGTH